MSKIQKVVQPFLGFANFDEFFYKKRQGFTT